MSNTIQARPDGTRKNLPRAAAALLAAALLAGGCDRRPPPSPEETAAATTPATTLATAPVAVPSQGPASGADAPADLSLTIDEPPVETDASAIVSRRDETVSGKPACAFEVRYKGAVDQPVVWNGEPCREVTALFVDRAKLAELGRYDALPEEVRDDIARSDGRALYVEGGFSSSLYPLNSAGRIYAQPLAD